MVGFHLASITETVDDELHKMYVYLLNAVHQRSLRTRCMIFFSKVLVGVASVLMIEPGSDDAKINMR